MNPLPHSVIRLLFVFQFRHLFLLAHLSESENAAPAKICRDNRDNGEQYGNAQRDNINVPESDY